jgi:hypothetical protein
MNGSLDRFIMGIHEMLARTQEKQAKKNAPEVRFKYCFGAAPVVWSRRGWLLAACSSDANNIL